MAKRGSKELRAGLFVFLGLALLGVAIGLLGRKDALFTRNVTLYAYFDDISGLTVGAPVRLVGFDVGTVADVSFPDDLSFQRARVTLAVQSEYMPRIRANSRVFIDSAGLLGDKVVDISMGDPNAPPLREGETLKSGDTISFEALSNQLHEAITSIRKVTEGVDAFMEDLREDGVQDDVATIARSLAGILQEVQTGDGLAHRLIYDRRYAAQVGAILADLQETTASTRQAVGRVERILAEVERGDGTAHALIYGEGGTRALAQLELAAREIEGVVREVREGEGLLHTLVYEEGNTNFLKELDEMAITLNGLVQEVDEGRGTIGGLLKDPTVYEQLRTLIGNVKRNVLFKALVRFTIDEDDLRKMGNAPQTSAADPPH